MNYMTIDGIPVLIEGEKNILEVVKKAGIKLPTFCYHSELSIYGACRMCMVEDEKGHLDAACSAQPWPGMVIRTNSEKLRKYRKMILELILANHCRDCTTCASNQSCKLQDLASRFQIDGVRFPNSAKEDKDISSPAIVKDKGKCILCGDCVRVCNEVQNVGAIDFAHRGCKMTIATAFDVPLADSGCVACGQCAAVCPTGAIVVKDDTSRMWHDLSDPEVKVTAQIAPAVRVAVAREFGMEAGDAFGYIVAAMHRMGFDEVFDTATGADLTVLEESNEFLKRLEAGEQAFPLFTSCCPAWIQYCERYHPDLLPHVSTCRSPMEMLGAVVKEHSAAASSRRVVHVAVMPCTAKKFEAARGEFRDGSGAPYVDHVITTQELIRMIRESGIVFGELEAESVDMPFGSRTGAGVIFGSTGGVTEAVLRRLSWDKSVTGLRTLAMTGLRGMEGVKHLQMKLGERELNIAVVSGLKNADNLIAAIRDGAKYDFVEVMACPGGCVSGAGQPYAPDAEKAERANRLYASDRLMSVKRSEENPLLAGLYKGVLKNRVHELLHVHYGAGKD